MIKSIQRFILVSGTCLVATLLWTENTTTHHHMVSKQSTSQIVQNTSVSQDVDLLSVSQPTKPILSNGQVNQAFINRFNNAITLNSKAGQFVINSKLLPSNSSKAELNELNKLVNQANVSLKQTIATEPKANIVQSGNSVVVADTPKTAKTIAQSTQLKTLSTYHEGGNYLHHYWWGYRVGLSKTVLHNIGKAGSGVAAVSGVVAKFAPAPQVKAIAGGIVAIAGLVGFGFSNMPGGIAFNTLPNATPWAVGWQ